jgi:hypothetical protein
MTVFCGPRGAVAVDAAKVMQATFANAGVEG